MIEALVRVVNFFMAGEDGNQTRTHFGHLVQGFLGVLFWTTAFVAILWPVTLLFSGFPHRLVAVVLSFGRNMGYWEQRELVADGFQKWLWLQQTTGVSRETATRIVMKTWREDGWKDLVTGIGGGLLALVPLFLLGVL